MHRIICQILILSSLLIGLTACGTKTNETNLDATGSRQDASRYQLDLSDARSKQFDSSNQYHRAKDLCEKHIFHLRDCVESLLEQSVLIEPTEPSGESTEGVGAWHEMTEQDYREQLEHLESLELSKQQSITQCMRHYLASNQTCQTLFGKIVSCRVAIVCHPDDPMYQKNSQCEGEIDAYSHAGCFESEKHHEEL